VNNVPGAAAESIWNPSWFLIVPLVLNVILLYPLTIARARKAIADGIGGTDRSRAVMAIGVSAVMLVAGVVYLAMVLPAKLR
jgi:hypothetical protein